MDENRKAKLQAIEDEMAITWDTAEKHRIFDLPAPIKKKYYEDPVNYQDRVEIWELENGQFVVYYSPTGATFLYDTREQAEAFRNIRVSHLRASYRGFGW